MPPLPPPKKKKDKRTNNDLQSITHKTKDQGTQTPLKQTMIYNTLHIKLKIKEHKPH